jgi:hypothetical protein
MAPVMAEAWTSCVLLVSLEYPVYQLSEWLQVWQKHGHPVFYWFRLNTLYISFLNGSSYGRSMEYLGTGAYEVSNLSLLFVVFVLSFFKPEVVAWGIIPKFWHF